MSAAQSAHVREVLADQLEQFSSWERMETEFGNLLRAVYKVSCLIWNIHRYLCEQLPFLD